MAGQEALGQPPPGKGNGTGRPRALIGRFQLIASGVAAAICALTPAVRTTGILRFRTSFIDGKSAAVEVRAVERFNGFLRFLVRSHGDESKPAGPARSAI